MLAMVVASARAGPARAQSVTADPEDRVIRYRASDDLADPVSMLRGRLERGGARLEFDAERGYLPALLRQLGVPVSSQALVFSKTSTQRQRIGPRTPRALYFSDSVYVGWVPGGDAIEVAGVDPRKGVIFYALAQQPGAPPRFTRREECLQCHESPKTLGVPGFLVRSVYTAPDGTPLADVDGFVSGHRSPLRLRWGGWYVTGTSAGEGHLGNTVSDGTGRFDGSRYLSPDSDIVSLLVLEHQVRMQDLIIRLNYETRYALDQMKAHPTGPAGRLPISGEASFRPGAGGEWARQRIAAVAEDMLEYMLFRDEAPLKGPVAGTSGFAAEFEQRGPRDRKGRSLRQLDLQRRLLRYPCSYLIYSPSFDALPKEARDYLWRRLSEILTGQDRSRTYASLTPEDRAAVLQILRDTKPEFAAWRAAKPAMLPARSPHEQREQVHQPL